MKLTIELIESSPSFINPVGDREIDLRGNKIPAIENLGATKDQYDSIDLSDNDVRRLENLPLLKRLVHLYLSNNRVAKIESGLETKLPRLQTLILSNNQLQELGDLDALSTLKSLRCLSLIDNPVTKKLHYRLYVIHKVPFLQILDFRRIRLKEREAAKITFEGEEGKQLAEALSAQKTKYFEPGHALLTGKGAVAQHLTADEAAKIKEAIKSAKTLEEVTRLEKILRSGHIPEPTVKEREGNANDAEQDEEMEDD